MSNIKQNGFTIKNIDNAIILITHDKNLEQDNYDLKKKTVEFYSCWRRRFRGIEIVGAVNDFVCNLVKKYYPNISMSDMGSHSC